GLDRGHDPRHRRAVAQEVLSPLLFRTRHRRHVSVGAMTTLDSSAVAAQIAAAHDVIAKLRAEVGRAVVGQEAGGDRLVIALRIRGHVLLEGVPGLAKTLLVKPLAGAIDASFHRIQFTPDLLPADITGTLIFDPANRTFTPRFGPIFANLVLADEINRAPAKVQSPLLEPLQERQRTI